MFARAVEFALDQRRDEWERVNLAMGMRHGHANRNAGILKTNTCWI